MAKLTTNKLTVKAARPVGNDVVDGVQRAWFKVGRKDFGVTHAGVLIDGDGYPVADIDGAGFVVGHVHDNDAYRVAEALRRYIAVNAAISADVAKMFVHQVH